MLKEQINAHPSDNHEQGDDKGGNLLKEILNWELRYNIKLMIALQSSFRYKFQLLTLSYFS